MVVVGNHMEQIFTQVYNIVKRNFMYFVVKCVSVTLWKGWRFFSAAYTYIYPALCVASRAIAIKNGSVTEDGFLERCQIEIKR